MYYNLLIISHHHKFYYLFKVHGAIQTKLELKEKELVEVKKESHKRKKMLLAQQHMLQAGANSYNKVCMIRKYKATTPIAEYHDQ